MGALVRHPRIAKRYLAIEGRRALAANGRHLAARVGPSGRSECGVSQLMRPKRRCHMASGKGAIDDPPAAFGVIRAKKVIAARRSRCRPGGPGEAPATFPAVTQPKRSRNSTTARWTTATTRSVHQSRRRRRVHRQMAEEDACRRRASPEAAAADRQGPMRQRTAPIRPTAAPIAVSRRRPPRRRGRRRHQTGRLSSTRSGTPTARATGRTGAPCARSSRGSRRRRPQAIDGAHRGPTSAGASRHGTASSPSPAARRRHRHRRGSRGTRGGEGRVGARRSGVSRQPAPAARLVGTPAARRLRLGRGAREP